MRSRSRTDDAGTEAVVLGPPCPHSFIGVANAPGTRRILKGIAREADGSSSHSLAELSTGPLFQLIELGLLYEVPGAATQNELERGVVRRYLQAAIEQVNGSPAKATRKRSSKKVNRNNSKFER